MEDVDVVELGCEPLVLEELVEVVLPEVVEEEHFKVQIVGHPL